MFKARYAKQLEKDASLEEVIQFMNELSEKLHNTSLRQSGIDPHDTRGGYDLSDRPLWTREGGGKRPNY